MARILYVENHEIFANQVTSLFLSQHDISIVASLAAARRALKTETFEMVLLDYDLDDGKGAELLPDIDAMTCRPYVVAVSSHEVGNLALLKAGANEICGKLQFSKIASVVSNALNRTPNF